jgi:hypothetical protein
MLTYAGWCPDSIHRSDEEFTDLVLNLRRGNQEERKHEVP